MSRAVVGTPESNANGIVHKVEVPATDEGPASTANGLSASDLIERSEKRGRAHALGAARIRLAKRATGHHGPMSLRELRLAAGMSQSDLGALAKLTQPRVARLEAGNERPGFDTLCRLADALKVDLNTLRPAFESE
jgi:ribosome-binding protein aMBF1 (putative translation factor)